MELISRCDNPPHELPHGRRRPWQGFSARTWRTPTRFANFPGGSRVEIFQLEDVVVGRTIWLPGWRWSEVVKPIAGTELCEYHHLGYSVSGRFRAAMPDGTEMEIPPNHVYEIPSGHDAWVVGDDAFETVEIAGI